MQPGQKVNFTLTAFPSRTFTGTVASIEPAGTTTSNVVTYSVLISVDQTDVQLLPAMTATVTIVTEENDNAVLVPNSAITYAQGAGRSVGLAGQGEGAGAGQAAGGAEGQARGQGAAQAGGQGFAGRGGAAAQGGQSGAAAGQDGQGAGGTSQAGGQGFAGRGGVAAQGGQSQTSAAQQSFLVVMRNGAPVRVPVQLGSTDGANTVVLRGLQPGDQVVTGATTGGAASSRSTTTNGSGNIFGFGGRGPGGGAPAGQGARPGQGQPAGGQTGQAGRTRRRRTRWTSSRRPGPRRASPGGTCWTWRRPGWRTQLMATIVYDNTRVVEAPPAGRTAAPEPHVRPEVQSDPFALLAEVPARGSSGLRLFQTIPSALAALRANKGRSMLTTLGIIIGVAAVIAIVALGEGASASVSNQLAGLGTNLLTITPGSTRSGGAAAGAGSAITLKAADADAIQQDIPGPERRQPGRLGQRPDHRRQPELVDARAGGRRRRT